MDSMKNGGEFDGKESGLSNYSRIQAESQQQRSQRDLNSQTLINQNS